MPCCIAKRNGSKNDHVLSTRSPRSPAWVLWCSGAVVLRIKPTSTSRPPQNVREFFSAIRNVAFANQRSQTNLARLKSTYLHKCQLKTAADFLVPGVSGQNPRPFNPPTRSGCSHGPGPASDRAFYSRGSIACVGRLLSRCVRATHARSVPERME